MLKQTLSTISLLILLFILQPYSSMTQDFITVKDAQFHKKGRIYSFLGTNFWYGFNLAGGTPSLKERLLRELNQLQQLGVKNLRIMAASEGPDTAPWRMLPTLQVAPGMYNENLLIGLDFLLAEMAKRDMHAVLCMNNMWPWSGGFAQYVNWTTQTPIPYPPPAKNGKWLKYMRYSASFFKNQPAQQLYLNHLRKIINRRNSITGISYKNDPTIMSWQLANEPRPILGNRFYRKWIRQTAAFIKTLDSNHLVSVGSEGNAFLPFSKKFKKEHLVKNIDYATMHIWIQNWGWYDPAKAEKTFPKALLKAKKYIHRHIKIAQKLKMPLVLEEFGIARDKESYQVSASTQYRDLYYQEIFTLLEDLSKQGLPIAGSNFWAWGGEGRPRSPKAIWQLGDDFIGDPPFEYQGWYSIYDRDATTLKIIEHFAKKH